MKIKLLVFAFLAAGALSASAQKNKSTASSSALPRPKLVVGIMVDQMRWDFLYRYYDRYQANGFKRLLNEGFTCDNTMIDYATTVTAIGHSTVYTGSVPAIHGISGNDFIIQSTGKSMYCTEDTTVKTVGSSSVAGRMSPRNLLSSTITDELKLATNFRSKVIGIALKDRGGILPAGHTANAAYWFDDANSSWISSTYYMQKLPEWVQKFNGRNLLENYLAKEWNTMYPIETYQQSSADNNAYEGKFRNEKAPVFPHKMANEKGILASLRSTPYANTLTIDFAKEALLSEQMGKHPQTDFLALSLSSPDYVGHQFGPNSIEIEDMYLRLDKDLAAFFEFLDKNVGKGDYTVFLTADHGVAHNAKFMTDNKLPAGFWPTTQVMKDLNASLESEFKSKDLVLSFSNYQVSLNNQQIAAAKLDENIIRQRIVAFLQKQAGVAYALDIKNVQTAGIPDQLRSSIINAYNIERSGVIQIILKPGWYSGYSSTGSTHGSWNPYDAQIPLVWMGWGIKQGRSNKPYHMTDIAPTLSALLHIQFPNGSIGQPITEVLK